MFMKNFARAQQNMMNILKIYIEDSKEEKCHGNPLKLKNIKIYSVFDCVTNAPEIISYFFHGCHASGAMIGR